MKVKIPNKQVAKIIAQAFNVRYDKVKYSILKGFEVEFENKTKVKTNDNKKRQ